MLRVSSMVCYVPRSRYPVTATMPLCGFAGHCNPLPRLAQLCSVTSTEEFTEFAAGAAAPVAIAIAP